MFQFRTTVQSVGNNRIRTSNKINVPENVYRAALVSLSCSPAEYQYSQSLTETEVPFLTNN